MKKILFLALVIGYIPQLHADTFTITVSTTVGTRVKNAVGYAYHYSATLADGSNNPESLAQFTLRMIKLWVFNTTVSAEAQQAGDTARQNQLTQSGIDIVIP